MSLTGNIFALFFNRVRNLLNDNVLLSSHFCVLDFFKIPLFTSHSSMSCEV